MTDERMSDARFEALAEAYGGVIARWPPAERARAAALMGERPDWAAGVLDRAAELDAALDAHAASRVSADLLDRIIAAAPRPRPGLAWLRRSLVGAGLAAACAAGVLMGVGLSDASLEADAVAAAMTSFDGGGEAPATTSALEGLA